MQNLEAIEIACLSMCTLLAGFDLLQVQRVLHERVRIRANAECISMAPTVYAVSEALMKVSFFSGASALVSAIATGVAATAAKATVERALVCGIIGLVASAGAGKPSQKKAQIASCKHIQTHTKCANDCA